MTATDATAANDRPWQGRQLHFVGIGGAGMSGLALIAHKLGASVTGSDQGTSTYMQPLRARGIEPLLGHAAANVPAGAEVVYSSAIAADNPERAAAGSLQLHRSELLAEVAKLKRCLAVSGAAGKTTTAAMTVDVLRGCGMDPAYAIGGELRSTGLNADWGEGEWIVIEADESDRSLLNYTPEIAVLTNAELDHHATYSSRLELEETFAEFTGRARVAVVWDRPELRAIAAGAGEIVAYDAQRPELTPAGARFRWRGLEVQLAVPGLHNAVNAAGALSACAAAGADPAAAIAAIGSFQGARRRMELLGRTDGGVPVYDDYAHHPMKVAAALAGARTLAPRRLVAVFQPHLYSRTRALARDFGAALAGADLCAVVDVYPARELAADFPGVDGHLIAAAAADAGGGREVAWMPALDDARRWLEATLRTGDLCLVMGAGNIDSLGRALVASR
ncbi:MAG: UDP-N-acetylmuramate--L-alanine ligase [Acidobacteriota bacterium]|nr:UDP-N-acetylmuramate--L-alanine ligase [Acidobacteriota bacterium]